MFMGVGIFRNKVTKSEAGGGKSDSTPPEFDQFEGGISQVEAALAPKCTETLPRSICMTVRRPTPRLEMAKSMPRPVAGTSRAKTVDFRPFPPPNPVKTLEQGKEKRIPVPVPPLFSKKAMQWGKKWPVQMNLLFFPVEAYVPGGVQNQAEKIRKSAFWPVPVQKFTFPVETNFWRRIMQRNPSQQEKKIRVVGSQIVVGRCCRRALLETGSQDPVAMRAPT